MQGPAQREYKVNVLFREDGIIVQEIFPIDKI